MPDPRITEDANADTDIAYAVQQELRNSPLFEPSEQETRFDSVAMSRIE